MKKAIFLVMAALMVLACTSTSRQVNACNFSGYSFCLALPSEFKVMAGRDIGDFFTHILRNQSQEYDVLIYEGNHPDLGLEPETVGSFEWTLGEVTYSADVINSDLYSYSVLLKREDVRMPTRIHVTTDASNPEVAIDEVLQVMRGCKEIPSADFRCSM